MGDDRIEDDFGTGRPAVSDKAVRTICLTLAGLAVPGIVVCGMILQPDHAVDILGGLALLIVGLALLYSMINA